MSSRQWSSSQRPPLNPLAAGQRNNTMKGSDSSPASARAPSATAQQTLCKRHSPDNPGLAESENAPLSLHNKRQRTKSGSDSIDPLIPSCQDSAIPPTDCTSVKGESMPLCEHNIRTSRLEVGQETATPNSEPSCSCTQRDSVSSSSSGGSSGSSDSVSNLSGENLRTDGTVACKNGSDVSEQSSVGLYSSHLPLANGSTSGGLSPHCAATLEYVTQLPEGCSGGGADPSVLEAPSLNSACVPDEELEDDDNYLDSSEEELEDELTLTNNEDDESCGEGEYCFRLQLTSCFSISLCVYSVCILGSCT